ncbi:cyclin-domain-containing protein [Spinellus fusiger]|nr:cyclin-domain-containing protein [Spinellus fusiger]
MKEKQIRLDIANFPVSLMAGIVSHLIESILTANDLLPCIHISFFHSRSVPSIAIQPYIARILKYVPFNNEVFLSLLVYFDRIAKIEKSFTISSLNIHRLLITSIVVATKFTSDVFYPNARYAKVGGLPLCELNKLELEFLFLCNFELLVRMEDMQEYGDQLLAHAMTQPALKKEICQHLPALSLPSPTVLTLTDPTVPAPPTIIYLLTPPNDTVKRTRQRHATHPYSRKIIG